MSIKSYLSIALLLGLFLPLFVLAPSTHAQTLPECGQQIIIRIIEPESNKQFNSGQPFQVKAEVMHNNYLDRVTFKAIPMNNTTNYELGTVWVTSGNTESPKIVTLTASSIPDNQYGLIARSEHYLGPGVYKSCDSAGVPFSVGPTSSGTGGSSGSGSSGSSGSGSGTNWAESMSASMRNCLIGVFGQERFDAIYINHVQPTQAEMDLAATCWRQYGPSPYATIYPTPSPDATPSPATGTGASTSSNPSPRSNSGSGSTPTSQARVYPSPQRFETSPEVESCLKKIVGAQRYEQIKSGRIRPNEREGRAGWECFSQKSTPVAPVFAPVAPAQLKDLPTDSKKIAIKQLEDPTQAGPDAATSPQAGQTIDQSKGFTLAGQAIGFANKTIFLYIFSDPIVMAAKTDKDGNWKVTLTQPLEPGQHEVYVAVEKKNKQFVRSDRFLFEVARAAPPGSSSQPGKPVVIVPDAVDEQEAENYMLIAAGLILGSILILSYVLRRKGLSFLAGLTKAAD